MTAQTQVPKLYQSVIDDVINNVREAFMDEGIDESVLSELKNIWQTKLTASKVMECDVPAASMSDPMIPGPFIDLQRHTGSGVTRVSGYQAEKQQQQQTIMRTPAVPVSSTPMFTTMTPPGAELSDAASMAYSSILQSQQQIGQANKGAVASGGATGSAGSRAQMVAAAAAAQPQYLFTSPGNVGSVIIPHSQAVRLQAQQQQQQGRGGVSGMRGSLPQVDGAPDNRDEEKDESPASDPNFSLSSLEKSLSISSNCQTPKSVTSQVYSRYSRSPLDSADRPLVVDYISADYHKTAEITAATAVSPADRKAGGNELAASLSDATAGSSISETAAAYATSFAAAATTAAASTDCISSSSASCSAAAASSSSAELRLSDGESLRGRILKKKKCSHQSGRPRKGDKIEIVFQVDGNHSSSDDDDDDDDDGDVNEDDSSDRDPDDEDIPGVEDEPLNSGDDVSDNDPEELFDTENVVVCQYEKISRVRNKWRFYLKDGIMNIQGRDYVFLKASGEAEW